MIFAVIIFSIYLQSLTLQFYSNKLCQTVYKFDVHEWYTTNEVDNRANFLVSKNNIKLAKKLITHELKTIPPTLIMNLIKEIQNAAEQITAEHAKELQVTEKAIKHIMSIHLQPDPSVTKAITSLVKPTTYMLVGIQSLLI
jgi:hypothetical protein